MIFLSLYLCSSSIGGEYLQFDPNANLPDLINIATEKAKSERVPVLLFVGDDGCIGCKRLNLILDHHPAINDIITNDLILVKAFRGGASETVLYLSKLPKLPAVPHFYVLDPNGKLILSQGTEEFEFGMGYDEIKLLAFFKN